MPEVDGSERPFQVIRRTQLDVHEAWRRLTAWERHGEAIPLTYVRRLSGSPDGVGTRFVARTSLGPVGIDDVMEVVRWEPPTGVAGRVGNGSGGRDGFCRIEKRGRIVTGWAEISVQRDGAGSRITWVEHAAIAGLGRVRNLPGQLLGRLLFARLVDRLLADVD